MREICDGVNVKKKEQSIYKTKSSEDDVEVQKCQLSNEMNNNGNTITDEKLATCITLQQITEEYNNICRICQSDENYPSNPLVSLCKCTGSVKYIHLKCLKRWFKLKSVEKITGNTCSYYIRALECELCKAKIPITIQHQGKTLNIINIFTPKDAPYIVLESIGNNEISSIHVSRMKEDPSLIIVNICINNRVKVIMLIYI